MSPLEDLLQWWCGHLTTTGNLCVEPWQGLPSEANGGYNLTQRPCILHLS
ncbi:MAG: hypothetical protein V8T36_10340 [Ruthenibacterium lactatiformans]